MRAGRVVLAAWMLVGAGWVFAQSDAGRMAFEVDSVRANRTDAEPGANFVLGPGNAYAATGGRFSAHNLSLLDYIRFAYKLSDAQAQVLEAQTPKWVAAERFDIEAKSEKPDPTKDQMRRMMQSLLANRFKLMVHTETQQLPILALRLAKAGKMGPQLRVHAEEGVPCATSAARDAVRDAAPMPDTVLGGYPSICGGITSAGAASAPSHIRIGGRDISMALLAAHLNGMGSLNRPVVDETGLQGKYDFVLEWGGTPPPGSNLPPEDSAVTLLEALSDQLGLKLVSAKGPVQMLVLDHVEQPSAN